MIEVLTIEVGGHECPVDRFWGQQISKYNPQHQAELHGRHALSAASVGNWSWRAFYSNMGLGQLFVGNLRREQLRTAVDDFNLGRRIYGWNHQEMIRWSGMNISIQINHEASWVHHSHRQMEDLFEIRNSASKSFTACEFFCSCHQGLWRTCGPQCSKPPAFHMNYIW